VVTPRRRFAVLPARTPTPPLTEARAEYVAEPVVPERPFRNVTEVDRLAARYEEMGLATAMGLLGMADGPSVAEPPPAPEPGPDPAPAPLRPQRPNLAQSRRSGLRVARTGPDAGSANPAGPGAEDPDPSGPPPTADSPRPVSAGPLPTAADPPPVPAGSQPVSAGPAPVPVGPLLVPAGSPSADLASSPVPATGPAGSPAPSDRTPGVPTASAAPATVDSAPGPPRPPVEQTRRGTPQRTVAAPLWPRPRNRVAAEPSMPAADRVTGQPAASAEPEPATANRTVGPPTAASTAVEPATADQAAAANAAVEPATADQAARQPAAASAGPEPAAANQAAGQAASDAGERRPANPAAHRRATPEPPEKPPSREEPLPVTGGPVYRAVLDHRAPAPPPAPLPPGPVVVAVPDELTTLFRQELGVEVAPIPVHRGRAVTQRAAELGARAFAHGGEVFLPDRAGPLTERPVRALLAHELAHAVQQRTLGAAQPSPDSADGHELEHAALAVEDWVAGTGSAPAGLLHRAAGPVPMAPGFPAAAVTQLAEGTAVAEPATGPPPVPASTSWTLRDGFTTGSPAAAEPEVPEPPSTAAPDRLSGPTLPWIPPREAEPDHEIGRAVAAAFQQIADLRGSVADLRAREDTPAEPRTVDLSEVVGRIYEYVRSRLRAELIVDRERAGLLVDIG
ncbi:DUF4157 domain-containing protein, partial [Amycolatopsis sp. NPDC049252]|uniref:eCIS core domain-containing protein n=1 Tax=Amycolatopsis sp. NPDC049252 TaxID=3363933 RepID=UPI003718087E